MILPLEIINIIFEYSDFITCVKISSLNRLLVLFYKKFRRRFKRDINYTIKEIDRIVLKYQNNKYKKNWAYTTFLKSLATDNYSIGTQKIFEYLGYKLDYKSGWSKYKYIEYRDGYKINGYNIPIIIEVPSIEIIKLYNNYAYIDLSYKYDSIDKYVVTDIYNKLKKINELCDRKIINKNGHLKVKIKMKQGESNEYAFESLVYGDIELYEGGRGYENVICLITPIYGKNNKLITLVIEVLSMHYYVS